MRRWRRGEYKARLDCLEQSMFAKLGKPMTRMGLNVVTPKLRESELSPSQKGARNRFQ